ncbi:MAG: hypothetical protein J5933_06115 [Clostridia bacterium]|nr:hypothetical protein [Clostridia bacterium]
METINSDVKQKSALYTELPGHVFNREQRPENEFLTISTEFSTCVKTVRIIVAGRTPERA